LRVPSSSGLAPDRARWQEMARFLEEEAAGEGIPIRAPRFIPWTRKAHELALHARQEGCFDAIHEAIFRAHFVDDRDIGRVDTLVEIATEGGLDPGEVRTVLGVDRFAPEIETRRKSLLSRGVRGVPTLEAAGRMLEGFPDVDGFRRFLGEVADGPGAPPNERKGRR
jgi:predicted DsbA family dithiol-disulfide isomerase